MAQQLLPPFVLKYFWGDDLKELDLEKNRKYIIQTLLEKGDQKAIRWLFSVMDKKAVKGTLPVLRLSKRSERFWNLYLS